MAPPDMTHAETDGTPWKEENGNWFWWRKGWGWIQYVGPKPQSFFNRFRLVRK
ncbi:hypothetical protein [Acinetobacter terrae]|uniref:Uncharacterized protein n=1 Tax=Acinetobacter terrae TaxID=2731247 RepID=A0ABX1V0T6_9GAMM|nr:hypothetical protein [Acinetobacter terrae]NNH86227.1 hypothetical protein [Acinetobacter terrae]